MSHPTADISPCDPRKKWSFNEVRVCKCMNSTGLPFELNLFIRASVISLWYWGTRRPSESWHLCHGWWSRQGGEHPSAYIPDHQFQTQSDTSAHTGMKKITGRGKKSIQYKSDVFVARSSCRYLHVFPNRRNKKKNLCVVLSDTEHFARNTFRS